MLKAQTEVEIHHPFLDCGLAPLHKDASHKQLTSETQTREDRREKREMEKGEREKGRKGDCPECLMTVSTNKGDTPKLQRKADHSRWRVRTASQRSRRDERRFATRTLRVECCSVAPTFTVSVITAEASGLFCETDAFTPSIDDVAKPRFRLMNSCWTDVFIRLALLGIVMIEGSPPVADHGIWACARVVSSPKGRWLQIRVARGTRPLALRQSYTSTLERMETQQSGFRWISFETFLELQSEEMEHRQERIDVARAWAAATSMKKKCKWSMVRGPMTATLLWMVMRAPTFAEPPENSSSWHLGNKTCNSPSNNYPHKSSTPRQKASAQWNSWCDISKARNTPVFVLNRAKWIKKVCWKIIGRSDSDWAGDSATRQSVTGHHCDVQNVTMCHRSLQQTAISLSSCEADFYTASACAGELLGLAELFMELHYKVSLRLEMDSVSARHILQRRGPGGLKHIEIRCLTTPQWVRANFYPWVEWTRKTTQKISSRNIWMDREHGRLRRSFGLRILDDTDGTHDTNGTNDNGREVMTTDSF